MAGKVGISIYLDYELLANVECDIEGKNRSEKLAKCIQKGYQIIMSSHQPSMEQAEPTA